MERSDQKWMIVGERLACIAMIAWLQLVGLRTNSVVHHILHAAPLVLLLFVPPSPTRHFMGFLAGFLWVFMLGVVTSMLHSSLVLGYLFTHPQVPYTWLAPGAALIAMIWAVTNAALLRKRAGLILPGIPIGIVLIGVFAIIHPLVMFAFEYPLNRTLDGEYAWIVCLLVETGIVLAVPSWFAFRISRDLRMTKGFMAWQAAYFLFFVIAMVAGLHPKFVHD